MPKSEVCTKAKQKSLELERVKCIHVVVHLLGRIHSKEGKNQAMDTTGFLRQASTALQFEDSAQNIYTQTP